MPKVSKIQPPTAGPSDMPRLAIIELAPITVPMMRIGKYSRAITPHFSSDTSLGYIRSTPFFPTIDHSQPAIGFGDGLFQGFNSADGSIRPLLGRWPRGVEASRIRAIVSSPFAPLSGRVYNCRTMRAQKEWALPVAVSISLRSCI